MAEELDTSWFDLKNYEKLNELDFWGWEKQLSKRCRVRDDKERAAFSLKEIKINPIIEYRTPLRDYKAWKQSGSNECDDIDAAMYAHFSENYKPWWHDPAVRPFNTYSVMSTPALFNWQHKDSDKPSVVTVDLAANDCYNGLDDRIGNISIDLTATDEQIKSDFSHWLAEYRKAINYESYKKEFTDKDLSDWVKWRLLPYIDLTLVAAIEKKTITTAEIGRLIYPYTEHHSVDITERMRKTVIPKANWLFINETLQALRAQIWAAE